MSGGVPIGAINRGWSVLAAHLCVWLLVWASVLPGPASSTFKGDPKRVMIPHSFGRDFRPWGDYATTIREELDHRSLLDIEDHSLITARSGDENPEPAFVACLNAPAANFIQRNRERLFASTPMVLTAVEQRQIQFSSLSGNDTVVAVAHDFPRSFETILRVLPATKQIVVINGASPNERFWLGEFRKEDGLVGNKVQYIWHDDIVEAHHGQVSAENQSSGGALFTIGLPTARGRSTSA